MSDEEQPQPKAKDACLAQLDDDFGGGDPQEKYRELCRRTTECTKFLKKLTECNDRVNSKTKTEEKCIEEVMDYMHCVDYCVSDWKNLSCTAAKRFFPLLK
ncbi:Cytochrome b-c1 complex subunit 6, mitochondrial [Orchesella cincta]|uniref:Cytochrome b-c1 complex subunit 6, mitochondrial n=1 Tax=Orchesella cincta TaxID=48709 RepID=A0A1D2NFH7_ORCCI|nr:Cytochrome b-c1 complex subunit 6, mitochondrial [Orchesella cincta]